MFSLAMPAFHAEVSKMLADVPAAQWQSYLRFHTIDQASPYLSDAFVEENFNFYNKTMRGQKELKERGKRVLSTIEQQAGEALGQMYVKVAFPAESKARMQELVEEPVRVAQGPHPEPGLDERRHQEEGDGEVGRLHSEDRLPGQVA
jgi:putative endopeptidase